jgi:hypothetical protein
MKHLLVLGRAKGRSVANQSNVLEMQRLSLKGHKQQSLASCVKVPTSAHPIKRQNNPNSFSQVPAPDSLVCNTWTISDTDSRTSPGVMLRIWSCNRPPPDGERLGEKHILRRWLHNPPVCFINVNQSCVARCTFFSLLSCTSFSSSKELAPFEPLRRLCSNCCWSEACCKV